MPLLNYLGVALLKNSQKKEMSFNAFLIKLNRFSGWALLVLMIAYFISGYGITKMIVDPVRAKYWHEVLLPIPTFIFFIIHIAISAKLSFIRWRLASQKWINFYVIFLSLIFLIFFLWLYFT